MPNRIIRESCRTSATLDRRSAEAERLFWRLTTVADDHGRFESDASTVRSLCFPSREPPFRRQTVEGWLQELASTPDPAIHLYQVNGKRYGCFPTWSKHQRVRAEHSKYPSPTSADK